MKLKYAALFLLLGAVAELFANSFHQVTIMIEYRIYVLNLFQWLHFGMSFLATVGLGLIGWAVYRRNDFSTVRLPAIFLAIVSACWILFGLYNFGESLIKSWEWFAARKLQVVSFLLMQMVPVAILIFALSIHRVGKIRRASWWLFAGGTAWLIWLVFDRLAMMMTYGFGNQNTITVIRELLKFLSLAYPVSMIVFGLRLPDNPEYVAGSVLSDNDNLLDEFPAAEASVADAPMEPSLKQWIGTFLLSAIPLAGTVLLIVWVADLKSRIRGNWAAALLLLQTLLLLFYTVVYVEPMAYLPGLRDLKFYLAIVVFVFLATSIGLIVYRRSHLTYEEENESQVPSIGKWMGNLFLSGLPLIGLILLIVWVNDKTDRVRRNWAAAQLIWLAAMFVYFFYAYLAVLEIKEYQSRSAFQF